MEWYTLMQLANKLALRIDIDKLYQNYVVLKDVFESIPEEMAPEWPLHTWAFKYMGMGKYNGHFLQLGESSN